MSSSPTHASFYSKAAFYDIAFQFKNLDAENSTLVALYEELNGRKPRSFLDIAAGPATNATHMYLKHSLCVYALDYAEEMVHYGTLKACQQGVPLQYMQGDMRNFRIAAPVDIAAIFMASTGYLLSNDDMVKHLQSVARNLAPEGLYALEMTHPRDVFGVGASTNQQWTETSDGCTVSVAWGAPDDPFDPIRQIRNVSVRLTYTTPLESGEIIDQCAQRDFSHQEMQLLVDASGVFDWVTTLGAWDPKIPCSNDSNAWRMIPILRKKGA